jgi:hypothetical protein
VPATSFELGNPDGLAIDASGNLVISDQLNDQVYVVANTNGTDFAQAMTAGDIYLLAGSGSYGFYGAGGPATSAFMGGPGGVAVDHAGNVLVADFYDNTVWLVADSSNPGYGIGTATVGDIYTIADSTGKSGYSGDRSPATSATLDFPGDVAVDAGGNVVIADTFNSVVRVIAETTDPGYGIGSATVGDIYTIAGDGANNYGGDGGPASASVLQFPWAVAFDGLGNLYIADTGNNRIRMVPKSSGTYYGISMTANDIYTVAGDGTAGYSGDTGPSGLAEINSPQGVDVTSSGTLLIADTSNYVLRAVAGGLPMGGTPGTPTVLTATPGNEQVALNWMGSSGATGYSVFMTTTPGGEQLDMAPACTSTAPTTSCTVTGLVNGQTYYFEVVATNGSYSSAPSNETSATPEATNTPGGAITLDKTTALIGNYPVKVSGTGWAANGDTSVTLNQCAGTVYSAATCDAANRVSVTLGTGKLAGTFKNAVIDVAVGPIDTGGDTCGVGGPATCYLVVVGNTGDSTPSGALGFTLPSFVTKKTTGLLGNYPDPIKASGLPIGDTVVAEECDAGVSVPATDSTHCDAATQVSGTVAVNGKLILSPGVTLRIGSAYSDGASGTCGPAGTCALVVTDSDNAAIALSTGVSFATPIMTLKETSNVLGNYLDVTKAANFPIGDTIVAQECDASVVIPTTVGSNCDPATQISGPAGPSGKVAFDTTGVTLAVGGAYADSAAGTCPAGGTCAVLVSDSANPSVGIDLAVTFATPSATLKASTNVAANAVDKVTAGAFPIGDTVTAQQCDTAVTAADVGTHCDSATQISGTVAANGKVTFTSAGVTILVGSAYSDTSGGTCPAGGSCDIVVDDSTHSGFYVAVPIGLAG